MSVNYRTQRIHERVKAYDAAVIEADRARRQAEYAQSCADQIAATIDGMDPTSREVAGTGWIL